MKNYKIKYNDGIYYGPILAVESFPSDKTRSYIFHTPEEGRLKLDNPPLNSFGTDPAQFLVDVVTEFKMVHKDSSSTLYLPEAREVVGIFSDNVNEIVVVSVKYDVEVVRLYLSYKHTDTSLLQQLTGESFNYD